MLQEYWETTQIAPGKTVQRVESGSDAGLHVEIYNKNVKHPRKTDDHGVPLFEKVTYIKITHPGGKDVTDRRITEQDKRRFASHWDAFQRSNEQFSGFGTPLEEWPLVDSTEVARLKYRGVHTVQQVASGNESIIELLGPEGRVLVRKAQAYLQAGEDSAFVMKQTQELEALRAEIEDLKDMASVHRKLNFDSPEVKAALTESAQKLIDELKSKLEKSEKDKAFLESQLPEIKKDDGAEKGLDRSSSIAGKGGATRK